MKTVVVAFLLALAVSFALTPLIRDFAIQSGLLDHALTSRKIHGRPIPRLGGVAIVAGFFVPLLALHYMDTGVGRLFWSQPQRAYAFVVGGLAMAALGVYDDLRGSGARFKFTIQVAVALFMWWADFRADVVSTPFGTVDLGVMGLPLTVLWIVGVTNALNLIDGLDGLAAGIALAAATAIFWVSFANDRALMSLFMAALAGGLLGFLRYNFHPASIFMGDAGSLFVGFVLATTALETHEKSTTAVSLLVPIVALGLPIGDTLLAMTRRVVRGHSPFSSDRGHIHHRLMARGLSHRTTVLALYAIAFVLAAVAVAMHQSDLQQTLAFVSAVTVIAAMLLFAAGYLRFDQTQLLADRRQNLAMRAAVREAGEQLRRVADVEGIWKVVQGTVGDLQASCAALVVVSRNGTVKRTEFSWGFDEAPSDVLRARFSLLGERPDDGRLELGFTDGRRTVDRDTEIAVELLCEHVRSAVERLAEEAEAEGNGARKLLRFRK